MTIIIHNIESTCAHIVEGICEVLHLTYDGTISFVFDGLYNFEITIEEKKVVPFMIRFFYLTTIHDYERIEMF